MEQLNVSLKQVDINEFKEKLYDNYLEIFPKDERKPLKLIEHTYKKKITTILEILNNDDIVGFMIFNQIKDKGYIQLDYFAIFTEYRNKGIGSTSLKLFLDKYRDNKGIFIEIEKVGLGKTIEENEERQKRKDFYERIGFKKLNFDLELFKVIYMPYVYSNTIENDEVVIKEVFDIYNSICGKIAIKKFCKIIK